MRRTGGRVSDGGFYRLWKTGCAKQALLVLDRSLGQSVYRRMLIMRAVDTWARSCRRITGRCFEVARKA